MGAFDDSYLRQAPAAKGVPVPVGEFSLTREASATVLQRGADGGWAYGEEIDLMVTLSDLEVAALPGTDEALFWSGITVRIDPEKVPEGSYWLVAAMDPASHFLFAQARMLPTSGSVKRALRTEWMQRLAAGNGRIEELPFDPFEDGAGWLTARLGDPFRPHWQAGATEEVGDGIFVDRSPNRSTKKRRWFFALCPENPGAVAMELTSQIYPFKEDVAGGAIAVPPRRKNGETKMKEDSTEFLLAAAVRQGMAGRDRNSRVSLEWQIRTALKDHFRDMEQRLWIRVHGARTRGRTKAQPHEEYEAIYQRFLGTHPGCDYFRRGNRLQVEILSHEQSDPEAERCRQLFLAYLRAEAP